MTRSLTVGNGPEDGPRDTTLRHAGRWCVGEQAVPQGVAPAATSLDTHHPRRRRDHLRRRGRHELALIAQRQLRDGQPSGPTERFVPGLSGRDRRNAGPFRTTRRDRKCEPDHRPGARRRGPTPRTRTAPTAEPTLVLLHGRYPTARPGGDDTGSSPPPSGLNSAVSGTGAGNRRTGRRYRREPAEPARQLRPRRAPVSSARPTR